MQQRFTFLTLILISGFIFSCSGGNSPTLPSDSNQDMTNLDLKINRVSENTVILGIYELYIDVEKETAEIVPLRNSDIHFDIWQLLTYPACSNCLLAKDLTWDPLTEIVELDLGWRNPYPINAYDIRTIVTEFGSKELLNADGYTELFGLMPGDINPFIALKEGPNQREFTAYSEFYDHFVIYHPTWPSWIPLMLTVECSFPANCEEPYELSYGGISGSLFNDGSNSPTLGLFARDWQNDVESVKVDLTPVGGTIVSLAPTGSLPDAWEGPVSCAPGTPNGDYRIHVWATTAPPFDKTADMHNYITLMVVDAPPPGAEIFGPSSKVSDSGGASFIWPRHSIAVTSDGVSHVVWVDSQTGLENWHVLYAANDGGSWSTPQQIDGASGIAIYATIAADPDKKLHIVWEDERDHVLGSDIYYANSGDGFASETIIYSGDNGFRNVHPKIESSSNGTLHVVWHTKELVALDEYEYDVWYLRKPESGTWDGALSIAATDGIAETFPAVKPGSLDIAYVAYQSDISGSDGIYFTKNPGGDFIDPIAVIISNAHQPSLDIDPSGNILLAYFDSMDGTFTDIYFRFSLNDGDTWGTSQLVSTSQTAYQIAPDVECTVDGDFHFAWHEENEMGLPGRVLYREYLSAEGWQDITEIVPSSGIGAFPSMDGDSQGHIHMVYEMFTPAEPPDEDNYEIWYRDSTE